MIAGVDRDRGDARVIGEVASTLDYEFYEKYLSDKL